MTAQGNLICRRCGRPVEVNTVHYAACEGMHELCFHLEFEHPGDPDAPCEVPFCPVRERQVLRARLRELGENPEDAVARFLKRQEATDRPHA